MTLTQGSVLPRERIRSYTGMSIVLPLLRLNVGPQTTTQVVGAGSKGIREQQQTLMQSYADRPSQSFPRVPS